MNLLALDTSTPIASVALAAGDRLLERGETVTTYSERLLPLIDALFVEAGLRPDELSGVVCGAGPGSFTGLRIGLSTAKGLCLATRCPLVMVSSLEVLAARGQPGQRVLAAIDAFRGEVYAGYFVLDEQGTPRPIGENLRAFSIAPEALRAALPDEPTHYIGDGFRKHERAVPADAIDLAPDETPGPRARELLRLGRARLAAGRLDDPRTAAPQYVRASAPEEARR